MEAKNLPEVQPGFRGAMKEILGQFVTTSFWKGLVKTLVQEAFATFLMTLGGVLVHYGKERRNKDVSPMVEPVNSNTARAFGGGYSPQPSFNPQTAFPLSSPPSDNVFPGFGERRI